MGRKLPDNESELYRRIDEVTHYIWNPIGVAGYPSARDEYYSILPQIFQLTKEKDAKDRLAERLNWVQSDQIGVRPDIERCKEIAAIIIDWAETLDCVG